jgi:two-component system, OmpR family, sensor histidine kinase KdpD
MRAEATGGGLPIHREVTPSFAASAGADAGVEDLEKARAADLWRSAHRYATILLVSAVRHRPPLVGVAVSIVSVAAITGLIYALREVTPAVSTGVVYLMPVLLVSSIWGLWLGLFTSLASTAAFNFFHLAPEGSFDIAAPEHWVALVVFFVAAVVTSTLTNAARVREAEAERRRLEADLAADMARLVLGGSSMEGALRAVAERMAAVFEIAAVRIELRWIDSDGQSRAIPLVVEGERVGTVLVSRDLDGATEQALRQRVIPELATLVAAARRRDELENEVVETKALRRSDVVQKALLRSVSHDLRSPLTAITTAVRGMGSDTLSEHARLELTAVAEAETGRLSHLVENLLDLSRLQVGTVEPRCEWCSVDEIARAAVASVTAPAAGFDMELRDDLPPLRVDAAQLERALANVLENCARYAGEAPVTVRAQTGGSWLVLRISDRGPGIQPEELESVFEPFHRSEEHTHGGSGLGLAIARGFVEANGGRLRAESHRGEGTTFVFRLPVPSEARAHAELAGQLRR